MLLSVVLLASCGSNEPESETTGNDRPENYEKYQSWYDTLFDTSWKLESSVSYYSDGREKDNMVPTHSYDKSDYDKYLPTVITLTSTFEKGSGVLYASTIPGPGFWWINEDGVLYIFNSYHNGNPGNMSAEDMGLMSRFFPSHGKIIDCTSTELVLENVYETGGRERYVFSRVYGYTPDDGGGNGGDSNYERPDIGLEDYTCATTSITLKYRIYNQEEAQVTSATGYYGTSSPSRSVSATVAGSLITIRISSLSKGTTYYVKCTAKGKGGSTTSETTRLSTLY